MKPQVKYKILLQKNIIVEKDFRVFSMPVERIKFLGLL